MRDTDERTRHPELLQAAGCLLVGMCALVALMIATGPLFEPRSVTLGEVAALTGLSFPPSATLRSAAFVDGPRPSLTATIGLSRCDVQAFAEQASWTTVEETEARQAAHRAAHVEVPNVQAVQRAVITPPRRDSLSRWSQDLVMADVWLIERRQGACLVLIEAAGA